MNSLRGPVRLGRRTKELIPRLKAGEIALIDHEDLDEVAARGLLERGAAAVLNTSSCLTGRYPARGALILNEAGLPVIDDLPGSLFDCLEDGDELEVAGGRVLRAGQHLGEGRRLTDELLDRLLAESEANLEHEMERFLDNTLDYARREKAFILRRLPMPPLRTSFSGRHALVVVRGPRYKEDLSAIIGYIRETRPVLAAVDGAADALVEVGLKPDLIVGDMDSVSDRALRSGAELVVHAYPNGTAPGLARVENLGLEAAVLPAPGTSEDIALLLAYELGASLIVAVGTHTHLIDFLDKGRAGMASTLLARLKVGPALVDAKGVSQLYRSTPRPWYLWDLLAAAMVPLIVVLSITPGAQWLLKLWWLELRLAVGL